MKDIKTTRVKDFDELPEGTMFILEDDPSNNPSIWVKTPFADMYDHNNLGNDCGACCNALCVNTDGYLMYTQCYSETMCRVVDTKEIFGTTDGYM